MGFWDRFTRPGLVSPKTGKGKYYDSAAATMDAGNRMLALAQLLGSPEVTPPDISFTPAPPTPGPLPGNTGVPPDVNPPDMNVQGGDIQFPSSTPSLPVFLKPSPATVLSSPAPLTDPSLTKLGKLASFLRMAGQRGLAGRAASEQAVIQSGGRRSGGVGLGFMAGSQEPVRQAMEENQVEAGQLSNQERKGRIALLPWQIAREKQALDLGQSEMDYRKAHAAYWNSRRGQKDQQTLQQLHAAAVEKAVSEGRDPNRDPAVQTYSDAITSIQRPPAQRADSPFLEWRTQNPDAPVEQWFDMQHRAEARYRKPEQNKATPTEFAHIETRKNDRYAKLHSFRWKQAQGEFEDTRGGVMTPDEYANEEQQIEDDYRAELTAAGGNPVPFSYAEQRGSVPRKPSVPANPYRH